MARPALQNVPVPFTSYVNGMFAGRVISIHGTVDTSGDSFAVDFQTGPNNSDNIAFHFNPRFNENCVVRNTRVEGSWQSEERQGAYMPFQKGNRFELVISCSETNYKVMVNGKVFTHFQHRLPYFEVSYMSVSGSVSVQYVDFKFEGMFPEASTRFPSPGSNAVAVPFRNLKHHKVIIIGQPHPDADKFAVNFMTDTDDIALHINPRFNEDAVVRNTCSNGSWGSEERQLPGEFPFAQNSPFLIEVDVTKQGFKVKLNGVHQFDYDHRIRPIKKIRTVVVQQDATCHEIDFY